MKQNKLAYYLYDFYNLLIIKYVFNKHDSSTRMSIKPQTGVKY